MAVGVRVLGIDEAGEGLYRFVNDLIVAFVALLVFPDLSGDDEVNDKSDDPDAEARQGNTCL